MPPMPRPVPRPRSAGVVAYFGRPGSFAHEAARRRFGAGADLVSSPTASEAFVDLFRRKVDLAVLPMENTSAGWVGDVVGEVLRLSEERFAPAVVDELDLPVSLVVLGRPGAWKRARRVYSHPVPFQHCAEWLHAALPGADRVPMGSTSEAAEQAARDPGSLAIANREAGRLYGLKVLVEKIPGERENLTRFFTFARPGTPPLGKAVRTSLWFALEDRPGTLLRALNGFARNGVNLTRLESRSLDAFKSYRFFVELEGGVGSAKVDRALRSLVRQSTRVTFLGSYPVHRL